MKEENGNYDLGEVIFYSICLLVITVHSIVIISQTWRLRSFSAVRKLNPEYAISTMISYVGLTIGFTLCNIFPSVSIRVFHYIYVVFAAWFIASLEMILLGHYVHFFTQEHRIEIAAQLLDNEKVSFQQFPGEKLAKAIDSSWKLRCTVIFISITLSVVPSYLYASLAAKDFFDLRLYEMTPSIHSGLVAGFVIFQVIYAFAFILYVLLSVRKVRKDRNFRTILVAMFISFLWFFLWVNIVYLTRILQLSFEVFEIKPLLMFIIAGEPCFVIISMYYHKVQTFMKRYNIGSKKSSDLRKMREEEMFKEMESMLFNSIGNKILLETARRDYSVEIVLFCNAIRVLKDLKIESEKSSLALKILNLHIKPSGELQVNIPFDIRDPIEKKMSRLVLGDVSDVFDQAYEHVVSQIYYQVYLPHRTSKEFQEYLTFGATSRNSVQAGKSEAES